MMNLGTYAHPLATKAWKISDYDGHCHIVWCDHGLQARRLGAQGLERDFDEVECERYPELDGFHGDLLTWTLENGWYFECQQCYKRTGLEYPGFLRTADDRLFCSEACFTKHEAEWISKRKLAEDFQRFAEVKYFGLGPKIAYVNVGGTALVTLADPITEDQRRKAYVFIERRELGL